MSDKKTIEWFNKVVIGDPEIRLQLQNVPINLFYRNSIRDNPTLLTFKVAQLQLIEKDGIWCVFITNLEGEE
jgi:hypothetical protein